jgi:AcrR family transcriptional regulator
VSPRSADPAVRTALVEAAARVVAADGPRALTTRRLAAEVGSSTMAVYTHFGSMDEVRRAIRREGFARLSVDLDGLHRSDDPVADLVAAGRVYLAFGLDNPELYRAMFVDRPPGEDPDAGTGTFQRLVDEVRRCVAADRFHRVEPAMVEVWAGELWTMRHGMVTRALSGLLPSDQVRFLLRDMTYRLLIGYGDTPDDAQGSVEAGSLAAREG